MKKLRMIITSVVVLAIVGSAFAFNAKKITAFCVSANDTSTDCSQVLAASKTTTSTAAGVITRKYYAAWTPGTTRSCTDLSSECTEVQTFTTD